MIEIRVIDKVYYNSDSIKIVQIKNCNDIPTTTETDKYEASAWCPHVLPGRKKSSIVEGSSLKIKIIVFDWDHENAPELKYFHLRHRTHSNRWRILCILKDEISIDPEDYDSLYAQVGHKLGMIPHSAEAEAKGLQGYDPKCSDITHFFYMRQASVPMETVKGEFVEGDVSVEYKGATRPSKRYVGYGYRPTITPELVDRLDKLHILFRSTAEFRELKGPDNACWHHTSSKGSLKINSGTSVNIMCFHATCEERNRDVLTLSTPLSADAVKRLSVTQVYLLAGLTKNLWDWGFIERLYLPETLSANYSCLTRLTNRAEEDATLLRTVLFDDAIVYYDVQDEYGNSRGDKQFYVYNQKNGIYQAIEKEQMLDGLSGPLVSWYRYKFGTMGAKMNLTDQESELLSHIRNEKMHGVQETEGLRLANGFLSLTRVGERFDKLVVEFKPNSKYTFSRTSIPYEYDPKAECPLFEGLLSSWIKKGISQDMLQEWFGLCLTSWRDYEVFMMLWGETRSGKGTIAETLMKLVEASTFDTKQMLKIEDRGSVAHRKMVFVDEPFNNLKGNKKAVMEVIKQMSTTTAIPCRMRFGDPYDSPTFPKLLFAFNNIPDDLLADEAFAARARVLRFDNCYAGREDTSLKRRLESELPGILNWALIGLERLVLRGRMADDAAPKRRLLAIVEDEYTILKRFCSRLPMGDTYDRDVLFDQFSEELIKCGMPVMKLPRFEASISGHNLVKFVADGGRVTFIKRDPDRKEQDAEFDSLRKVLQHDL